MQYNAVGDILRKTQNHQFRGLSDTDWSPRHKTTHDFQYSYNGTQPHTATQIGERSYRYDLNGNTTEWTSSKNGHQQKFLWDEENRLQAVETNGKLHSYIYDTSGERTVKVNGNGILVDINGVNTGGQGTVDNYTLYVAPHFTVQNSKFTKHFFVGSQRIASKLGEPGTLDEIAFVEKVNPKKPVNWKNKQDTLNNAIKGNYKWIGQDGEILTAGKSGKIPPGILN